MVAPIESCPPTPSAATSNKAILFDDEIGSIVNELSIETHDRPARSDLRVSEERLLKLPNGCIHQCRQRHDIIARRQPMMQADHSLGHMVSPIPQAISIPLSHD